MFVWETASPIGCRTTTSSNRHVGGEHMLVPASTSLKAHQESFLTGKVISHCHRIRVHVYRCIGAVPAIVSPRPRSRICPWIGEVPSQALIKAVLFPFRDNGFPCSIEVFWAYNRLFWAKAIPLCVFSPFIVCSQQQSLSSRVIVAMDLKTPPTTYAMSLGCNQELSMRRASHMTVLLGGKFLFCTLLTRTVGLRAI